MLVSFRPCIDFFRKDNRIFLTKEGINQVKNLKLTGTKISEFFKLFSNDFPNEEENKSIEEEEEIKTPYKIWENIFNFPFVYRVRARKEEQYFLVENKIRKYLEKNFNKKWNSYPLRTYDVFNLNNNLGGVPDGEEIGKGGKIISILEIKTITDIRNKKSALRFLDVPINYQLQLALYLYLRGVDTGYICICYLHPDDWINIESIDFSSPMKKHYSGSSTVNLVLDSWIEEIGKCEYEFQLLEAYCNNFLEDNELIFFKVKINLEKYEKLVMKLCRWFENHKEVSPEMTEKELQQIKTKYKHW